MNDVEVTTTNDSGSHVIFPGRKNGHDLKMNFHLGECSLNNTTI